MLNTDTEGVMVVPGTKDGILEADGTSDSLEMREGRREDIGTEELGLTVNAG